MVHCQKKGKHHWLLLFCHILPAPPQCTHIPFMLSMCPLSPNESDDIHIRFNREEGGGGGAHAPHVPTALSSPQCGCSLSHSNTTATTPSDPRAIHQQDSTAVFTFNGSFLGMGCAGGKVSRRCFCNQSKGSMRGSCSVTKCFPVQKQLVHITFPLPLHSPHRQPASTEPLPTHDAHVRYPVPWQ